MPRRSRYGLARGVTLIWLAMLFVVVNRGGFEGALSPLLFLAGSALVPLVWLRTIRDHRAEKAVEEQPEAVRGLGPEAFRGWVAARFRDLGYSVKEVERSGEEGVDLIGRKAEETVVVRCNNDAAQTVGEPDLRALYGAMREYDANYGYFVTTGRSTGAARDWALGRPIEIWDRDQIAFLAAQAPSAGSSSSS